MGKVFIFLLTVFSGVQALSQSHYIDSLKNATQEGTKEERLQAMLQLAYDEYEFDIEKALEYATEARQWAIDLSDRKSEKFALSLIGEYYYNSNNFPKAIQWFRQSESIKIPDAYRYDGYNYILWANTYRIKFVKDSAATLYKKALPLLEKSNDHSTLHYARISYSRFLMDIYQLEQAREILSKAFSETSAGDMSERSDVYLELGMLECLSDNYLKARAILNEAAEELKDSEVSYTQLKCYIYQGIVEFNLNNISDAISYMRKALGMPELAQYDDIRARVYHEIGRIYAEKDQYDLAIKYYLDGLRIAERIGMNRSIAGLYNDMAWLYFKQYADDECVKFTSKALEISTVAQDEFEIAHAHSVMGSMLTAQGKYNEAIARHDQALAIRTRLDSKSGIAQSLYNLSTVYERRNQLDQSISLVKRCLELDLKMKNPLDIASSYNRLLSLMLEKKDFVSASYYLPKADSFASISSSPEIRKNVSLLAADLYQQSGDLRSAISALRKAIEQSDSLYGISNLMKISEMRALFDLETMEAKERERNMQIELQKREIREKNNLFVRTAIVLLVMIILVVIIFNLWRISRRKNEALKEEIKERRQVIYELEKAKTEAERSNRLKTIFLGSLSHEVRTPLQGIQGLVEVIELPGTDDLKRRGYMKLIQQRTSDLQNIIESLLDMASLETGEIEPCPIRFNLNQELNKVYQRFRIDRKLEEKGLEFSLQNDISPDTFVQIDIQHLNQVLSNLILNAIKFTENGSILLSSRQEGDKCLISVSDSGIGIPEETVNKIFEPFRQAHEGFSRSKGGIGLGLAICKKMTEMWGGQITVSSRVGEGSIFTISIPL